MTDLEKVLEAIKQQSFENNYERHNADAPVQGNGAMVRDRGIVRHLGGLESPEATIAALISESKGDLNITVTRTGANIDAPLPFVLFGSNDFTAGYASTLPGLMSGLPTGTAVAVSSAANGDILFTYTNSDGTDVVKVSNVGNLNMKSFLASMTNNYFSTKYFLCSISNEDYNLQQYAQPLFFGLLSALGMSQANQLIFRSRTNSWQYRKDRVEVVLPEQKIVPDFSFAMSIIPVDGFSIGFDFFMSKRTNLNAIG